MHYNRCTDQIEYDHEYEAVGMVYSSLLEVLSLRCIIFIKPKYIDDMGYIFEEKEVTFPGRHQWNKTVKKFDEECIGLLKEGWKCEWAADYIKKKYPDNQSEGS